MAKWGEGDPRWIVEERPDATNVNNWHWTEKNATPWSKERLFDLFKDFTITNDENMECTIEEVEKCTGEAYANNRKGKLIFFYEWDLLLKWKGYLTPNSSCHRGKISIPNLSEENELKDIEITVTIDESNDSSEILKQFMYNVGREKIRQLIDIYITELKEEYSKNLILPMKSDNVVPRSRKPVNVDYNYAEESKNSNIASNPSSEECLDVCSLFIEEKFKCSAVELYNVLVNPQMVEAFTRGPAKVDAIPGGEFQLYGGNVQGYFEELEPKTKLVLRWRLKSWPSEHYSKVVIELKEMKSYTELKLSQSEVPASECDIIKANWYRYYWHSIKQTFGFGVSLL